MPYLHELSFLSKVELWLCRKPVICSLLFASAATTLTGLHFAMTTLMTLVMKWLGYIQPSYLPLPELVKFAFFANLSIVGMNVSLMWNSVGFYQVKTETLLFCNYIGVKHTVYSNTVCLAFFRLQSCVSFQSYAFWKSYSTKFVTQEIQSSV